MASPRQLLLEFTCNSFCLILGVQFLVKSRDENLVTTTGNIPHKTVCLDEIIQCNYAESPSAAWGLAVSYLLA